MEHFVSQTRLHVRAILNITNDVHSCPKCAGSFLTKKTRILLFTIFYQPFENSTTEKNFLLFLWYILFFLTTLKLRIQNQLINQINQIKMSASLDKSLDDIISSNKKTFKSKRPGAKFGAKGGNRVGKKIGGTNNNKNQ